MALCIGVLLVILFSHEVYYWLDTDYSDPIQHKQKIGQPTLKEDFSPRVVGTCSRCRRHNVSMSTIVVDSGNQIGLIEVCDECRKKLDITDNW